MQLAQRQRDGRTLRDHLVAAERGHGYTHPLLKADLPPGGDLLWQALQQLAGARPQGLGAAGAIPPSEVHAWQCLNGLQLTPWEVETLQAMDTAMRGKLEHYAKRGKAAEESS